MPRGLTAPDLADDAIRLEPLGRSHAPEFAWATAADPEIVRYTLLPSSADEAWVEGWLGRYEDGWADGSRAGFAIRALADGSSLGFAALVRLDLETREGEIGYALPAAARGRGAATRAVGLLTGWGFSLGLERLELRIDVTNGPSIRVAERCGYRLDGVLRSSYFKEGRRCDLGVWSRLATDQ